MITEELKKADHIPAKVTEVVRESVINTFASICGEAPEFVDDPEVGSRPLNGIIGNIAVFNPELTFSLMMALPKDTALKISDAFLGMELPFDSDDMGDLIGEIANILAGEVAANIEKVGFRGQSSLPTATRGSDLTLFMPNKPPTEKMLFNSPCGQFMLNMAMSESK
ncbi:chemotaxis protein CheX [Gracilimonas mengyeensis]|uniref:Chemotaxis protein CheX n=1 Tax=Gracilimonas mengyeensis TaxID=1302730 RepID=A0A521D756_9BACT|nr:chemotaxis protein CheX [Gracilimonas mengyeensis]SMO67519.1 chemotaxis protein CheX [Gracilimonas mengyeensis]